MRTTTQLSPAENVPAGALPNATAYLKTLKPARLKRLYHHLSHNRLVMMHSCDCLLGFEGEYSAECKKPFAIQAESELFNYPIHDAAENDENNQIRSRVLMTIINRILEQKKAGKRWRITAPQTIKFKEQEGLDDNAG